MTTAAELRARRRELSREMRDASGREVIEAAFTLPRFIAYELIQHHREAPSLMNERLLRKLARTLDSWDAVDMFSMYLAGPAWRDGRIDASVIEKWTRSKDRWWRRAALVATVPLSRVKRTKEALTICELLVADRDDMVVKAMSWSLREVAKKDTAAARRFIEEHDVAARVRREVGNKIRTGKKG